MRTLSQDAQQLAYNFIITHARPLEQARYFYHFQNGPSSAVIETLSAFQNADGGFGHALEPDIRLPDSSVIATTHALQILREIGAAPDHPLIAGAMRYLLATYDATNHIWPIIPANVDDAPHAPWWNYNPDPAPHRINPTPEIAGYCAAYADHVPDDLRESLLKSVVDHFMTLPDHIDGNKQDAVMCYIRLYETTQLPDALRDQLETRLKAIINASVSRDPAEWGGYAFRPLKAVHSPESPLAAAITDALALNLDYLIDHQDASGAWLPYWSWGGNFPDVWPVAEREWQGILTFDTLLALKNFGRLA